MSALAAAIIQRTGCDPLAQENAEIFALHLGACSECGALTEVATLGIADHAHPDGVRFAAVCIDCMDT